ncbi:MAG: type II toxin-antitoxin system CcdA family antitoxin [Thermodesulfobacteriota bacterium]
MPAHLCDESAPQKAANLSVNSDLLRQARGVEINLSQALEQRLVAPFAHERRQRWREENRAAVSAYNHRIEADDAFSDPVRSP